MFHKTRGRYLAPTAHKQLICLCVYLVDLRSLIREAVRFVVRKRYWELPSLLFFFVSFFFWGGWVGGTLYALVTGVENSLCWLFELTE